MAELATMARPYAHAVFEIAKSAGRFDAWSRALNYLSAAIGEPRIRDMLESPLLGSEQKAHTVIELCREELDDRGRRFVLLLARNKRLALLPEISVAFEALRAEQEKILDVEVISAYPLTEAETERLVTSLASRYDRKVELATRVDESLLGGAIIRAGDTVIDGSVRGKLQKLSEALLKV
jgi:F-type H+-transporting ATPase subunit delta